MGAADAIHNHTVDPATGFIENKAYVYAFDAVRKREFLNLYRANGLKCKAACASLGISFHTIQSHYRSDRAFKEAFDDIQADMAEQLESKSMAVGLTDRGFMDRCMQLRRLKPSEYAPEKISGPSQINIVFDGKKFELADNRVNIVDAQVISDGETPRDSTTVEHPPTVEGESSKPELRTERAAEREKNASGQDFPPTKGRG